MQSPFAFSRPDLPSVTPQTIEEAADTIREAAAARRAILVRGGGTKWSVGRQPAPGVDALVLNTTGLRGIVEYDPGELTFTAFAGTPLSDIQSALAANGQYMPFDPPFVEQGATLGGTIAAGLSGPRRMRYGGLRDFVIGVEYLNAEGNLVRGGGKVVKNAAGYDLPKLFCGSLGTLGVLVRVSFKVFPRAKATQTLMIGLKDAKAVQTALLAIQRSTAEVSAADAWPTASNILKVSDLASAYTLAVQLEGPAESLPPRLETLKSLLPPDATVQPLDDSLESQLWSSLRDAIWIAETETVARLYAPPNRLADLDACLNDHGARRAYSVAGNTGWAAITGDPSQLAPALEKIGVRATVWRSKAASQEIIPALPGAAIVRRIKQAFDANNLFYPGRYAAG